MYDSPHDVQCLVHCPGLWGQSRLENASVSPGHSKQRLADYQEANQWQYNKFTALLTHFTYSWLIQEKVF